MSVEEQKGKISSTSSRRGGGGITLERQAACCTGDGIRNEGDKSVYRGVERDAKDGHCVWSRWKKREQKMEGGK